MAVPLKRDVPITVPLIESPVHAEFVCRNGKRNIVKGQWLHKSARKKAAELGTDGLLIAKQSSDDDALIIVSKFDDPNEEAVVHQILEAHGVRAVPVRELAAFADEIEAEAHE